MGRELLAAVLKLRYRRFAGGGGCYKMERFPLGGLGWGVRIRGLTGIPGNCFEDGSLVALVAAGPLLRKGSPRPTWTLVLSEGRRAFTGSGGRAAFCEHARSPGGEPSGKSGCFYQWMVRVNL